MTIKCRTGTEKCSSSQLDTELIDTLVAISVVSKRLAEKLNILSKQKKNGKPKQCHTDESMAVGKRN